MAVELIGAIAGAGSFVLEAVKCLAAPIGRPFKYLYDYDTNFRNLEKEVRTLKNTRDDVQVMVTNANVNVEEIKQSVKDWQTTVNNTITEAERLIQEKEDNPGCFKGLRPNCITRYKHSKKAFKLKQDIVMKQEEKFDSVSYPTIPLEKNFDKLRGDVSKLKNARLKVQCKITEAKNNVEEITEDVTEIPDTKKIQTVIANKLGLKFEDAMEDESQRASKLYSRMEKRNILLIIDNIWGELDLKIVGIPSLADRGRNKILMTTRNVDVLEKMGSTKNLGMGILNEEEAWRLFQKMAGNYYNSF
ncbi:hypothetical protein Pint_21695 [Pistacia integerrima]|uniref:Uncharacterized protein n=1 Tax=Pistacia integerrima TaxID=434235 RepID=A0ACC0XCT5_9ROSI|nr:hypothetical protein Pint_21695 [Pistacia integerrima]